MAALRRIIVALLAFCFQGAITQGDVKNTHRIVFKTPAPQIVNQKFTLVWRYNGTDPLTSFSIRADCIPTGSPNFCRVDNDDRQVRTTCKGIISLARRCRFMALDDRFNRGIPAQVEGWSDPFTVFPVPPTIYTSEWFHTAVGLGISSPTAFEPSLTEGAQETAGSAQEANRANSLSMGSKLGVAFGVLGTFLAVVIIWIIRRRRSAKLHRTVVTPSAVIFVRQERPPATILEKRAVTQIQRTAPTRPHLLISPRAQAQAQVAASDFATVVIPQPLEQHPPLPTFDTRSETEGTVSSAFQCLDSGFRLVQEYDETAEGRRAKRMLPPAYTNE